MTLAGAILWICGAIAGTVFCVMLHSIATFRQPAGAGSRSLRHGRLVEILWASLPILIIVGTATPAVREGARVQARGLSQDGTGFLPGPQASSAAPGATRPE